MGELDNSMVVKVEEEDTLTSAEEGQLVTVG
jgi:hypothetical protein